MTMILSGENDLFSPPANPFAPGKSIRVTPSGLVLDLLLTATTGISHHDPAAQDDSNTLLFNRALQVVKRGPVPPIRDEDVSTLADTWRVPATIAAVFEGLSAPEFLATALVKAFLDCYNSGEGSGLFEGVGRYERLETRLRAAAVRSASLRALWGLLCHDLQVSVSGSVDDLKLLRLMAYSGALAEGALRACQKDYRQAVMLARLWHTEGKLASEQYARAAGKEAATEAPEVVNILAGDKSPGDSASVSIINVPAISANSLRHQVVRGPGTRHLFATLGIPYGFAGDGVLPLGAEAIFANGGNIRAGSKQPSDPFGLAWEIRRAHPLLDLIGGVTDSFDIGESRLKVAGWLVCEENRNALIGTAAEGRPNVDLSAFDLLDDVTATRQATERGSGQMIYNYETLCPGTEVLCRLVLPSQTDRRTVGALAASIDAFLADGATIGGQGSRGFGWMQGRLLTDPVALANLGTCKEEYLQYLADNRETLREGLEAGTLGARAKVVS